MDSNLAAVTAKIKENALGLGFDLVGIAKAEKLEGHGRIIADWCASGMNASMSYLCRDIEKRTDPRVLFPGARSVIVTALSYYTEKPYGGGSLPVISRYALGMNYHDLISSKLNKLLHHIRVLVPGISGKAFVDSAPLLEKGWARRAGLGWPGRHSILINKDIGSFFFIGILITDLELEYDMPYAQDHCGTCRLCRDACPVNAINENRTIDAGKCIAYLTIESREPLDQEVAGRLGGRAFGCDICQEVCPWNRHARHHSVPEFEPSEELLEMTAMDWEELTRDRFRRMFRNSAIGRKKFEVLKQNVTNVTKSNPSPGTEKG